MEKTIKTVGGNFLDEMADIVRPLGGVDMLHIDSEINVLVDDAYETDKQLKELKDTLKLQKVGLRKIGVGTHYGYESVAIVGEDESVEDALNTKEVKQLILNLRLDGLITKEQYDACYKDKYTTSGKVRLEGRTE
jgi:hypothetical protein